MPSVPKRLLVIFNIVLVSVIVDQYSKLLAVEHLKGSRPISYLGDFFRFHYAENTGAMLGFGSSLPANTRFWLLTVAVGLLLLFLLGYLLTNRRMVFVHTVGLSLIAGGGISNFIDRLVNDGRVVDFMNMGIETVRTGIFNVADVLIMCGMAVILLLGTWKQEGKQADEPPDSAMESDEAQQKAGGSGADSSAQGRPLSG